MAARQTDTDSSDAGDTVAAQNELPPLMNTLATTLAMFPLAETHESRETGKRRRQQQSNPAVFLAQTTKDSNTNDSKIDDAIQGVLFPTEDDVLGDSIDRLRVDSDTTLKKRRSLAGNAVSILNRRVMALLEQTSVLRQPQPQKLPASLCKQKQPVASKFRAPKHPVGLPAITGADGGIRPEHAMGMLAPAKSVTYMIANEFGVRMVTPFKLFDYQIETVRWMADREDGVVRNPLFAPGNNGCLLAMVMGLGKTPTAATLVARTLMKQRSEGSCSIYVCPKNLLGTVRYQFEKFFGDQMRIIIYHQNFLRSEYNAFGAKDIRNYDLIITNYSTVNSRMTAYNKIKAAKSATDAAAADPVSATVASTLALPHGVRDFCEFEWFRIILDESHEIRERKTARFKTVMAMKSPRRICLTGTPIHNKVNDLYAQMEFCGLRLPRGTKQTKQNLQQLRITDMIRFVEYKDAKSVTLPPKHVHKVYFDLSDNEKVLHRFYMDNARSIFAQAHTSRGKQTFKALASMIRVLQVCSAPYLITEASKDDASEDMVDLAPAVVFPGDPSINRWVHDREGTAGLQSSKMHEFVDLLGRLRRQTQTGEPFKVVVFANMTSTLRLAVAALVRQMPDYESRSVCVHGGITSTHKREELFTRFRIDPAVETLFMTLKMGCVGLNLTEADKVIFLEPWYSYSSLSQGETRVHRIGQVREVDVFYLLAKDSAEERVYRIAQNKKTMADDVKSGTVASDSKLGSDEMRFILMDCDETATTS